MVTSNPLDEKHTHRRTEKRENRLPPTVATIAAAVIYPLLPDQLLIAPRLAIPIVEVILLIALLVSNPRGLKRRSKWSRRVSVALAGVVILTNLVALGTLVDALGKPSTGGLSLLLGAMQVWLTNVIGFALLYWELVRGGPVARRQLPRDQLPPADWRFSQDENNDSVAEVSITSSIKAGWIPIFIDYLYLSLTNSSAFSPTDTMPLSGRAKALMGL